MAILVRAFGIALLLVPLLMQSVSAADNRIIVQSIGNSSGDHRLDPLSDGFSDLLVAYLSAYEELEILYRDDLHRIWQELARNQSGLSSTDAMQIGKLIQANTLVKGGFVKINGSFRANVHIYDIATTQLRHSFEESSRIEDVEELALSMAQHIADRLINHGSTTTMLPVDSRPLINTHFMKGLGYYHSGLFDHAVAEFMQVIDLDPARADARKWLGNSYAAGGEHDHARIEFERFLKEFPNHEDGDAVSEALSLLDE